MPNMKAEQAFDAAFNWPARIASLHQQLEDEKRRVKRLVAALKKICQENGDRDSDLEEIEAALFYVETLTRQEREQVEEGDDALAAIEDEAAYSRRGV